MDQQADDLKLFSHEHLFAQIANATIERGHYTVHFYKQNGLLSREATSEVGEFYYYPSAGTIRDDDMNIVYYSSLIDKYSKKNVGEKW